MCLVGRYTLLYLSRQPTNDRQGWIFWIVFVCGLAASATDIGMALHARTSWLQWWDVPRYLELTAGDSSDHLLCWSTTSCSNPVEYWWKPAAGFWRRLQTGIKQADAAARAGNDQYNTWLKPVPTSTSATRTCCRTYDGLKLAESQYHSV